MQIHHWLEWLATWYHALPKQAVVVVATAVVTHRCLHAGWQLRHIPQQRHDITIGFDTSLLQRLVELGNITLVVHMVV